MMSSCSLLSSPITCIGPAQQGQVFSSGSMTCSIRGRCFGRWPRLRLGLARCLTCLSASVDPASSAASSSPSACSWSSRPSCVYPDRAARNGGQTACAATRRSEAEASRPRLAPHPARPTLKPASRAAGRGRREGFREPRTCRIFTKIPDKNLHAISAFRTDDENIARKRVLLKDGLDQGLKPGRPFLKSTGLEATKMRAWGGAEIIDRTARRAPAEEQKH
jgi:hypothetical protein